MLRTTYFATFHTIISYCVLLWGHSAIVGRVFALQRRAVRVVGGLGYRQDCKKTFAELRIMTLPGVYAFRCLQMVRMGISKYTLNSNVHDISTRRMGDIHVDRNRIERSRSATNFWGPKLYNVLSQEVRSQSLKHFSVTIKKFLLDGAFYSLDECLSALSAL